MEESFFIHLHDNDYRIKPFCEVDCMMYEVFTNCDKLFTLHIGADGNWKTHEANVIPINENLINEIGDAIANHIAS
jgi:hypothetical protein